MVSFLPAWLKSIKLPFHDILLTSKESSSYFEWNFLNIFYITFTLSTVVFVLFQKKLLPKSIGKYVSKLFFYPTYPLTLLGRIGHVWTPVDKTIFVGCAPMAILNHPQELYNNGIRGVVNLCWEYEGPLDEYARLGMKQLRLPVIDHEEPTVDQYEEAIKFINSHKEKDEKVYIHCKAGHGRSAAVALVWMLNQNPEAELLTLNKYLRSIRNVRKSLYRQKNVLAYQLNLLEKSSSPSKLLRRASMRSSGRDLVIPDDN